MNSLKVLEMLNKGQIDKLKAELQDEVYMESLKKKPGAKNRYTAMKKYFTYVSSVREALQKPCLVDFQDKQYTAFTNGYSLVLTKEDCGELEMFDKDNLPYPDVTRLIDFTGNEGKIDFTKVFAEAKSKGYKLKKSEVLGSYYLLHYKGSYYRLGLIDCSFGIINDGEEAAVFHLDGDYRSKLVSISEICGSLVALPFTDIQDAIIERHALTAMFSWALPVVPVGLSG